MQRDGAAGVRALAFPFTFGNRRHPLVSKSAPVRGVCWSAIIADRGHESAVVGANCYLDSLCSTVSDGVRDCLFYGIHCNVLTVDINEVMTSGATRTSTKNS